MPVPHSFRGHGTFVYNAAETIQAYGNANSVAAEAKSCGIQSAWVRIHGRTASFGHDGATRELVAALRAAGIAVAGWGWCQGDEIDREADLAAANLDALNISDYVADIEEGTKHSHWTPAGVTAFLGRVRARMPPSGGIAVSSFAIITWHSSQLMTAADPIADVFAPQAYWFHYPNQKMRNEFGASYPLDNAAAYAKLTLADWRRVTTKPVALTGQAYWEEGIDQAGAEAKVNEFLAAFDRWPDIIGFNWWHFGGHAAMSRSMRTAIALAHLESKPFHA